MILTIDQVQNYEYVLFTPYMSSQIYENRTIGLLEPTHLKVAQLK